MAFHAKKPPKSTVQVRFSGPDRNGFAYPLEKDDVVIQEISSSPVSTSYSSSVRTSIGSTKASSTASPGRTVMGESEVARKHCSTNQPRPSLVLDLFGSSASSSALPESLSFSASHDGHWITAWSSSRVYLFDAQELPEVKGRSFLLSHRVAYADAAKNGRLLAILSNRSQVEVLRLNPKDPAESVAIVKSVVLSDEAQLITLSPDGSLLAAGLSYGIELISLKDTPPSWPSRRTIACDGMDSLSFTSDSRTLIATSVVGSRKITTLFSVAREFDPNCLDDEDGPETEPQPNHLTWIREVFFPDTTPGAQQATVLQSCSSGVANYLFGFNDKQNSWGIYDLVQKKYVESKSSISENTDCTERASPQEALPAISRSSPYVAVAMSNAFRNFIWFYPLPNDLSDDQWSYDNTLGQEEDSAAPVFSRTIPLSEGSGPWNITTLKWVEPANDQQVWRRIIAAGHIRSQSTPVGDLAPSPDSPVGKIVIIDIHDVESGGSVATTQSFQINIDDCLPAGQLPQREMAFDREVELVRRRTLAPRSTEQARRVRASMHEATLRRSMLPQVGRPDARRPSVPDLPTDEDGTNEDTLLSDVEVRAAFEEPYANAQPRSQAILHRAATVAAVSPATRRHLLALPNRPLPYNRADGLSAHDREEEPWSPPPPVYADRMRDPLLASNIEERTSPRTRRRLPNLSIDPVVSDGVTSARLNHPYSESGVPVPPSHHTRGSQSLRNVNHIPRRPVAMRSASDVGAVPSRGPSISTISSGQSLGRLNTAPPLAADLSGIAESNFAESTPATLFPPRSLPAPRMNAPVFATLRQHRQAESETTHHRRTSSVFRSRGRRESTQVPIVPPPQSSADASNALARARTVSDAPTEPTAFQEMMMTRRAIRRSQTWPDQPQRQKSAPGGKTARWKKKRLKCTVM